MHYIYRKETEKNTVIYIKGRLESVTMLTRYIPEFDLIMREDQSSGSRKEILLDLAEAEFISEDTLKYFHRLKSEYEIPVRFVNYSLYIEMQLEEFKLLD